MDEKRKRAYRYLLYQAMLEIRMLQWRVYSPLRLLNPFRTLEVIKFVRRMGALADYLHNLAFYSAIDFQHFDEAYFWSDYDNFCKKFGDANDYFNYRHVFADELERQNKTSAEIK